MYRVVANFTEASVINILIITMANSHTSDLRLTCCNPYNYNVIVQTSNAIYVISMYN